MKEVLLRQSVPQRGATTEKARVQAVVEFAHFQVGTCRRPLEFPHFKKAKVILGAEAK